LFFFCEVQEGGTGTTSDILQLGLEEADVREVAVYRANARK